MSTQKRIIARFIPQAWVNDGPVDIDDGVQEIDITNQILAMPKSEALAICDDSYESDALIPFAILAAHQGPFRVECELAISGYFEDNT